MPVIIGSGRFGCLVAASSTEDRDGGWVPPDLLQSSLQTRNVIRYSTEINRSRIAVQYCIGRCGIAIAGLAHCTWI